MIYLLIAAGVGGLLTWLSMPAGWLIGALLTGVFYRLLIGNLTFHPLVFLFAFALIGVNIGLSMKITMFSEVASVLFPLAVGLVVMLLGSWGMSQILYRHSPLDAKTALFCCVPGGASVMILLSEEYGADQRVVAAFHSARIVLLVLSIPLLAGAMAGNTGVGGSGHAAVAVQDGGQVADLFPGFKYLCIAVLIVATLFLANLWKIPAAQFLYAMLLAFLFNQFVVPIGAMPNIVVGLGQVLLGAIIGLRFDRTALARLKEIGWLSVSVLLLSLVLGIITSFVFFLLTKIDYVTSLLSMVPGGAPQMASTASLLGLDATMVAAIQLVRLLIIFFLLPIVIPLLVKKREEAESG